MVNPMIVVARWRLLHARTHTFLSSYCKGDRLPYYFHTPLNAERLSI